MDDIGLTYSDYVHKVNGRTMMYTRNTMCREGIMIPAGGYNVADSTTLAFNYRDPINGMSHLEEINNFSMSGIGELASVVYPPEGGPIRCFVYGYANYLAVPYSCLECRESTVECLHDNLVGVLLQEARAIRGSEASAEFFVDLKRNEVRPREIKMAFFGTAFGAAKIVKGPSGHLYRDCFMKQELFVKSEETKNLSVSPTLQRSLVEEGIQGLNKSQQNAGVSKLGTVHSKEGAGPHMDASRNNEAVKMPHGDLAEREDLAHVTMPMSMPNRALGGPQ
jgi:hypothetical protein